MTDVAKAMDRMGQRVRALTSFRDAVEAALPLFVATSKGAQAAMTSIRCQLTDLKEMEARLRKEWESD